MIMRRRGIVCDCRAAEIVSELYGGVGAGPTCWGVDIALGWRGVIGRALCFLTR